LALLAGCPAPDDPPVEVHAAPATEWTCPMHPEVRQHEPGVCPSCGMKLVERTPEPPAPAAPVGDRAFSISTERQQLVGVKLSTVEERPLQKALVAAGTLASDETRIVETPSPVSGVVEEVLGNQIGQEVRRGEPLLVVTTDDGTKATVRATATGHISWRVQSVGAKIPPNYNVCTIYDHAGIWVWVQIFESDIPWVKLGQPATMTVPAYPGRTFQGRVTQIAPLLDPETHTMRVRVDSANSDFALKPGMSAAITIHADVGPRLAIPEAAVLRTGAEDVVFVSAGDGRFLVRDVELGLLVGDQYEVVRGLAPGDRIVTSANFLVDSESKLQGVRDAWGASESAAAGRSADSAP
jgi:multidrug efflux pump subunit AcrA (membrane-fusion protein)